MQRHACYLTRNPTTLNNDLQVAQVGKIGRADAIALNTPQRVLRGRASRYRNRASQHANTIVAGGSSTVVELYRSITDTGREPSPLLSMVCLVSRDISPSTEGGAASRRPISRRYHAGLQYKYCSLRTTGTRLGPHHTRVSHNALFGIA